MKYLNKKFFIFIIIFLLNIVFLLFFKNIAFATSVPQIKKTVLSFKENDSYSPYESISSDIDIFAYINEKKLEFEKKIDELKIQDRENYDLAKTNFETNNPTFDMNTYPSYIDLEINDYSSLFTTAPNLLYAVYESQTEEIPYNDENQISFNYHLVRVGQNSTLNKKISSLNVTIEPPIIGENVTGLTQKPIITIDGNANCSTAFYIKAYPSQSPNNIAETFVGTIEANKDYYVYVRLEPNNGYEFDTNIDLTVNNSTNNYEKNIYNHSYQLIFYAKLSAIEQEKFITPIENPNTPTKEPSTSSTLNYEYIEGQNQTFNIANGTDLFFRVNADYFLFENGGKVYIDDKEVEKENYISKSGSTIITFKDEFVRTLAVGEHTLKVIFNNGGSATTKFTTANETETVSVTIENTASTPAVVATASTLNNPQTGDNIAIWISLMVVSMLGIIEIIKMHK